MIHSCSKEELAALHPDLAKVLLLFGKRSKIDTFLVETERSQKQAIRNQKSGVSWTTKSRHVCTNNKSRKAEAFDLAPCNAAGTKIFWERIDLCKRMNVEIMAIARELKIPVEWGGDWKSVKDWVHWQLARRAYPAK